MIDDANPYVESNFSWAEWTPNTTLKLCRVPWDASYRDVVRFASRETQQEWFDKLDGVECRPATMHIFNAPARVELPFNEASNWNYLVAYNDYPGLEAPRAWYYYIQHVEYVNAHCTQLTLMLDVWQSFQFDVTFGSCYVTRGHIGIANENQWKEWGRTYLTLPEGLDTGSEMTVQHHEFKQLYDIIVATNGRRQVNFSVLIVSTVNLEADGGTASNPSLNTSTGSFQQNQPNGTTQYLFAKVDDFVNFMFNISRKPWQAQGIIAIYALPSTTQGWFSEDEWKQVTIGEVTAYKATFSYIDTTATKGVAAITVDNFRNLFRIPERYHNLQKFLTFPYCCLEVTLYNGSTLILRPELVGSDTLTIWRLTNFAPPSLRMTFFPRDYGNDGDDLEWSAGVDGNGVQMGGGEFLDTSVSMSNFPQFCGVNNNAMLSLANQAHSIAWSYDNADWAQAKARLGVNQSMQAAHLSTEYANEANRLNIGNRNATNAIAANSLNKSLAISQAGNIASAGLQTSQNNLNALVGAVQSLGSAGVGLASGNVLGAAGSLLGGVAGMASTAIANRGVNESAEIANSMASANTANSLSTNTAMTAQANSYGTASTNLNNRQTMAMANVNASYAMKAISGDYNNAIAGLNAKVQDTKLTAPSTIASMGGDAFNHALAMVGVTVKWKTIQKGAMTAIGEYWLRYGYFVQRFITPPASLECMEKFTYWQMQEAYVMGTLPEEYRLTIKGMFERGVTVWDRPEYIGVTDWADNEPLPGISYE